MKHDHKSSKLQREIENNLKRAYDDVVKQDVPDRFTDLLAQLRASEQAQGDKGGDNSNG